MISNPIDFSEKRFFITGGTGFVGRTILDYFCKYSTSYDSQFSVTVLTRSSKNFLDMNPKYHDLTWLRFIDGDLDSLVGMESQVVYTDVIHAAADTHAHRSRLAWFDQLVGGTRSTLEFSRRSGAQRFLLISSGTVYDPIGDGTAIPEDEQGAPQSMNVEAVYGNGKRAAETLGAIYQAEYGLTFISARCFAIVSPHIPLDGRYALGNFVRDAIDPKKTAIEIHGDGLDVRSYLDGQDMVHAMLSVLQYGMGGESYNIGSDIPISIKSLAEMVVEEFSPQKKLVVHGNKVAGSKAFYVPNVEKLKAMGVRQEVSLKLSLETLRASLKKTNLWPAYNA